MCADWPGMGTFLCFAYACIKISSPVYVCTVLRLFGVGGAPSLRILASGPTKCCQNVLCNFMCNYDARMASCGCFEYLH